MNIIFVDASPLPVLFAFNEALPTMIKKLLIPFLLLAAAHAFAQQDTGLIYNSSFLKPGFYRSYDEYLHNSPSIATTANITPLYLPARPDTLLIGCGCHRANGGNCPAAWGYCDGHSVYLSQHLSLFKKRWLAFQYIGRIPFFLYWHQDVLELGGRHTGADSLSVLPYYHLMYVNEQGKARKANKKRIKALLAAQPALLKQFQLERRMDLPTFTKYLVKLNETY